MEKLKTFLRRALYLFKNWYRARTVRKVFLCALALTLICLIIAQFDGSGIFGYAAIGCGLICAMASTIDTWQSYKSFKQSLKDMQFQHFVRVAEIYGGDSSSAPPCFGPQELSFIKNKRNSFRGTIAIKTLAIVCLILLLLMDLFK